MKKGKIIINPGKHIYELQEEFNYMFPFLSISFFKVMHKKGEMSPSEFLIDPSFTLGEVALKKDSGTISIDGNMKVIDLENTFKHRFGLSVQVFRKCGGIWLETTATDGWTLNEQNLEGKALTEMNS